ncbi:MAG: response regulator transcription factor [Coriobacteriia bacterium]|nr:response regulator transcription factor [Coriobacteriia bacterium]
MSTVLIVDDEANIRELVSVYLQSAGFTIECAADGPAAVKRFREVGPDLVVLDIMLPGMTGAEVCKAIRVESSVPILMLTAKDTDADKVALLEGGADDYVVKPFSPPELVARVRALLRRAGEGHGSAGTPAAEPAAVRVGGLAIDPATREVTVDDAPIALTAREFDILLAMARRPGVVLSRDQLLEAAVGYADFAEARGVDVHIRHIREKLRDDAAAPRFLETVRGVGYRVRKDAP